jgi:hypothetical protein
VQIAVYLLGSKEEIIINFFNYKWYTFVIYLLSFTASAQPALSVSYVEHPAVKTTYMPIVKAMYKQANIPIELFQVNNSPRSVKALNDGFSDADIGKILSSIEHHDNITYVPTPIASVALYLVCAKNVPCHKGILNQKDEMIVSRFNRKMLTNVVPIASDIAQIISQKRIDKMLRLNRVRYSLVADDSGFGATQFQSEFQVIEVSRENYYHILHKKHQHLISKLNLALNLVLSTQAKK